MAAFLAPLALHPRMYEVEVKVPADHGAVEERLAALGARREATLVQRDTYYDAPGRDFAETDEALRIRRETRDGGDGAESARVTYKGPLVDRASKTRKEHEVGVADGDGMAAILDALGFEPVETVEKERDRYRLDGYAITVDTVAGVGEFVEVETEAPEEEIETAREGVYDLLRKLGLDPDDQVRTSYLELLLDE